MWYNNIMETIGHTPLVRLNKVAANLRPTVLAKVEYLNPGLSIKDRVAWNMVREAEEAGALRPGATIVEPTSGNTGMGIALIAGWRGYRCIFTMKDKTSKEKVDALRALGAEVVLCPSNVEADDPQSYYSVARKIAAEIPGSVHLNQYDNPANRRAFNRTLGPEIWKQTEGRVTHLVATMGTCGTLCGTGEYLKSRNPDVQIVGVDAYGSLLQKLHETGEVDKKEIYPYLTEAVGRDMVPGNFNRDCIDRVIKVHDRDSANMARRISREESLFVGWSCGAAVFGALKLAEGLGDNDLVVVILPDHGSRYLAKIYNDDWMREKGLLEDAQVHVDAAR